jgi:hypothetical protein
MLFFVKDSVFDNGLMQFRTIFSRNSYKTSQDNVIFITTYADIIARARFISDTMILDFLIDSQNPLAMRYGLGEIIRKYVHFNGAIPPLDWPLIY